MPHSRSSRRDRLFVALASIATLLAAITAAGAWILPDLYQNDPSVIRPQLYGQDLVTMLAAVVIAVALRRMTTGSLRARIVVLGGMLYLAYGYLMYAYGVRFNAFFLPYLVILSASTFALLLGAARFPVRELRSRLPLRRSLAIFLLVIPLLFGGIWLIDIVGAYASGSIPNAAAEVQMPTSPVHVQDLAFVLPLSAAAGILLWRRHEWAALLSGIVLVKAITICLAMLAMGAMAWRVGEPLNVPVAGAALVTLAVAGILAAFHFRGLEPAENAAARAAPPLARAEG